MDNFEEKLRNLKDPSKQRTAIINQLNYHKFVLKSKRDNKSRFQQSAQGRAFTFQELKKNLQYIITVKAKGDQQQDIDDTKRQPGQIQERLKIANKSIKSKLGKFNSRKKHNKKNVSKKEETIPNTYLLILLGVLVEFCNSYYPYSFVPAKLMRTLLFMK